MSFYLTASRERDIAANWTIVNMSVVLPILMSIVWFKDSFSPFKVLGVVATLASILLIGLGYPKTGAGRPTPRWFLFIGLAFATNAFVPALLRFVPAGQSVLFTTYLYSAGSILFLLVNLFMKTGWNIERGLVVASMGAAATHWSGIVLTILALAAVGRVSNQAGIIVYPITNGLVIPIAVVLGAWLLHQRFTLYSRCGVAFGVAAMVLLSLP